MSGKKGKSTKIKNNNAKISQKKKEKLKSGASEKEEVADISRLEITVATIDSAKIHPHADRLFVEKMNIGTGKKYRPITIVSGIADHFTDPKVLEGKKVLVCTNLEPAILQTVKSEGMLLCASKSGKQAMESSGKKKVLEVISPPEDAQQGEVITFGELSKKPPDPSLKPTLLKLITEKFHTNDEGVCMYEDTPFMTSGGKIISSLCNAHIG